MPNIGARGRWLGMIAITTALAAGGLYWARLHALAGPLEQGTAAYERGDWEEAARLARVRLKTGANDTAALRLAARASARLGRTSSALTVFDRLGSQDMLPEDLYLLGIALKGEGNNQRAVQVWEQARAADPMHAETLLELTRAYIAARRFIAAAETGRILASCPGWEARADSLLGAIQLELDDPAGAVTHWQRALGRDEKELKSAPMASLLHQEIARALLQAGRPVEARTHLERLLAEAPTPERYWMLSRAYLQERKTTDALAADTKAGSFRDHNPLLPEPARYVGSLACADCHHATFDAQQSSRHARTFYRASELDALDLPSSPFVESGPPKVSHTLRRTSGHQLEQETHTADQVFRAIVDYAFGSGDRALTFVGHDAHGQARELRLSHYHARPHSIWDVTAGHPIHPTDLAENLGQPLTADAVRGCFLCHVTNPRAVSERTGPGAHDHGIGCEKCHGPGGNHLLAVADKFPDLAIARPTLASGAPIVALCGQCHSPLGTPVSRDDPTAVRFQATTLTWSRCYRESNDTLDCTTCHDPHRNVSRSTYDYESKCKSCHAGQGPTGASSRQGPKANLAESAKVTVCPVNATAGCIGCHMPTVKDVVPHSTFTDHFIRVHRD
jgi:tetratricopeptide (TPR) repeat protein